MIAGEARKVIARHGQTRRVEEDVAEFPLAGSGIPMGKPGPDDERIARGQWIAGIAGQVQRLPSKNHHQFDEVVGMQADCDMVAQVHHRERMALTRFGRLEMESK